jgi:hypothetical protein
MPAASLAPVDSNRARSATYSFIVHVIGAIMPTSGQSTKTDARPTSRPQGGASRWTWLCADGVLARFLGAQNEP